MLKKFFASVRNRLSLFITLLFVGGAAFAQTAGGGGAAFEPDWSSATTTMLGYFAGVAGAAVVLYASVIGGKMAFRWFKSLFKGAN